MEHLSVLLVFEDLCFSLALSVVAGSLVDIGVYFQALGFHLQDVPVSWFCCLICHQRDLEKHASVEY